MRQEIIGGATLYLGDCREILPTLSGIGAIISDPPYGIGYAHGGNDVVGIGHGRYSTHFAKEKIDGDDEPFDPSPLLALGLPTVLFGANHFAHCLPPSAKWLIWDKRAASHHCNDFADVEMAWTNIDGVARIFRHHWDGMMKASEQGQARVHPTQKPVALMKWVIGQFPVAPSVIADPFMGSGTTGVAAVQLQRQFIGIELNEKYFDVACRRIDDAQRQQRLEL